MTTIVDFFKARGVWENRASLLVIGWRLLWLAPMFIAKCFFLGFVAIGWGPDLALRINRSL